MENKQPTFWYVCIGQCGAVHVDPETGDETYPWLDYHGDNGTLAYNSIHDYMFNLLRIKEGDILLLWDNLDNKIYAWGEIDPTQFLTVLTLRDNFYFNKDYYKNNITEHLFPINNTTIKRIPLFPKNIKIPNFVDCVPDCKDTDATTQKLPLSQYMESVAIGDPCNDVSSYTTRNISSRYSEFRDNMRSSLNSDKTNPNYNTLCKLVKKWNRIITPIYVDASCTTNITKANIDPIIFKKIRKDIADDRIKREKERLALLRQQFEHQQQKLKDEEHALLILEQSIINTTPADNILSGEP